MDVALTAFVAAPALALGSFLNVVASRLPAKRSFATERSECMSCGTQIAWYDNIPLASYAVLRGRCRSCDAAIPWRYPAVEGLTALLVTACFVAFGFSAYAVLAAAFCAVLVVLSAIDLEHRILPNAIVVPSAAAVLAAHTLIDPSVEWVVSALAASTFLFLAALAYPRGMGMGDVKLALLMGAMLGATVSVALMAAMIAALVPSLVLLARHGSAARKMAIPFGPFLALGSVVALFAGEAVLDWYLGFIG